jgi:hypothetical protein
MEDNALICDDFAVWEKQINEGLKAMETVDFKLYLKIMIYYQYTENDTDTITITYIQVKLVFNTFIVVSV